MAAWVALADWAWVTGSAAVVPAAAPAAVWAAEARTLLKALVEVVVADRGPAEETGKETGAALVGVGLGKALAVDIPVATLVVAR